MRSIAHAFLAVCCLMAICAGNCPAEENRSWTVLGQAEIQKIKKNLGTIPFRPELSIEENNLALEKYRSETSSIAFTLPVESLDNSSWKTRGLVDRRIQVMIPNQRIVGRITSVTIAPNGQATIFAQFQNDQWSNSNRLIQEETGVLSIGE